MNACGRVRAACTALVMIAAVAWANMPATSAPQVTTSFLDYAHAVLGTR